MYTRQIRLVIVSVVWSGFVMLGHPSGPGGPGGGAGGPSGGGAGNPAGPGAPGAGPGSIGMAPSGPVPGGSVGVHGAHGPGDFGDRGDEKDSHVELPPMGGPHMTASHRTNRINWHRRMDHVHQRSQSSRGSEEFPFTPVNNDAAHSQMQSATRLQHKSKRERAKHTAMMFLAPWRACMKHQ